LAADRGDGESASSRYASLDLEVAHDVVNTRNINQNLAPARLELEVRGVDASPRGAYQWDSVVSSDMPISARSAARIVRIQARQSSSS
jgi:hypothetical protein